MNINEEYLSKYGDYIGVESIKAEILSAKKKFDLPSRGLYMDFPWNGIDEELAFLDYEAFDRDDMLKCHHEALSRVMGNDFIVKLIENGEHKVTYLILYKMDLN